jgi:hypothetical protein
MTVKHFVVAGFALLVPFGFAGPAFGSAVESFHDSVHVGPVTTLPEEDNCFHQAATLTGTFTVDGHTVSTGTTQQILTRSTFDYSVRYADPSLPVFTGRQRNIETLIGNAAGTGVYNFHQTDKQVAADGSRLTLREVIHVTLTDGVLRAVVFKFDFTCS